MSERRRIPLRRKALYSLAVTVVALLALEGLARVLEPHLFPYRRTLPVPGGYSVPNKAYEEKARDARRRAGVPKAYLNAIPMRQDMVRGWSLPVSTTFTNDGIKFHFNSFGMRGKELGNLEDGDVRILTLGDSSIFGAGVPEDDVFSTVAAERLSKDWGRKVIGVVGAAPGHDSSQSLMTLQMYGEKIEPTWVVVGCIWSDIYREDKARGKTGDLAYLPPIQQHLRGYALYRLAWRLFTPFLEVVKVGWIASRDDIADPENGIAARVPLAEYIHNLNKIAALTRELGARLAVVILPAPMDFDKVPPPVEVQEYRRALRRLAEHEDAPLLDGPKVFRDHHADIGYFFDHVHPSQPGHQLLGEALAETLEAEGPPPEGMSQYGAR